MATTSGIALSSSTKLPRLCRVLNNSRNPFGRERLITILSYRVISETIGELRWLECDGTLAVKTVKNMHNLTTGQIPWIELVEPGEDVVSPTVAICVQTCREPHEMDWLGGDYDDGCWI